MFQTNVEIVSQFKWSTFRLHMCADMCISVIVIVLTNAALGSRITRNARTIEAIDNIRTATTIVAWVGTAFIYICNIPTETKYIQLCTF